MIIDCHAHLLPPERTAKLIRWQLRFCPSHPVPVTVTLETLLPIFLEETEPLNEWNWRLGRAHPRIVPFGTCHPLRPTRSRWSIDAWPTTGSWE